MNRAQRGIVILYCLLLVYCCVWIPWHFALAGERYGHRYIRAGYGWLWRGPSTGNSFDDLRSSPDLAIVAMRFVVITTICIAAYLLAREKKSTS